MAFAVALSVLIALQALAASSIPSRDVEFNKPREIKKLPPAPKIQSVRVFSWNVDHGSELKTIGSELAKNSADLCLLQEVDWRTNRSGQVNVAAELAKRLNLDLSYGIEFEKLSQERGQPAFIGQATLSRLPILKSRILRFQTQSGFWKPRAWVPSALPLMQRRLGSRIALVTELEFAGGLLVVYNLHLESRSLGRIQSAQLGEVLADLKQYARRTPAIIGGDLNSKYFPSRYLKKLEREGFRSCIGERIERTHTIAMALDWIFVRGPVKVADGKVRKDFSGSDHYPIYAHLTAE